MIDFNELSQNFLIQLSVNDVYVLILQESCYIL
jgi:hypothetical protein